MRVEHRLRDGFERNGSAVQADIEPALGAVIDAARRRIRVRRSMVALTVVLSVAAVVVLAPRSLSFLRDGDIPQPGGDVVVPTPSPPPNPLVGTWRVSRNCAQENSALERAGLAKAAARLNERCAGPSTNTAVFRDLTLSTYGPNGGLGWTGPYRVVDAHTFVAGHVTFRGTLYLRFRFTIRGDTLTVHLIEDAYPIPGPGRDQRMGDLVAQTIGWNSAPLHRLADQP